MQDVERLHAVMRRRPFSRRQRHRSHETGLRLVNGSGATSQPVATKKHAKAGEVAEALRGQGGSRDCYIRAPSFQASRGTAPGTTDSRATPYFFTRLHLLSESGAMISAAGILRTTLK